MIIVSACLAGVHCRYDGGEKSCEEVIHLVTEGKAIPVCPEQMGGLPTPRLPAEITGDKVIRKDGVDVPDVFNRATRKRRQYSKTSVWQSSPQPKNRQRHQ